MAFLQKLQSPKAYAKTFLKWGLFGLLMGIWGGLLGAGFHHALHFVTHLRGEYNWLIFLLPVGGLLSVGIYTLFRQRSNRGTNEVIDAVLNKQEMFTKYKVDGEPKFGYVTTIGDTGYVVISCITSFIF